jgi:hypothetical protein
MINPFQPNIIDDPVLSETSIYLYRKKKRIAIHKPPALIRFAPIKQALAVTVEPFKFSPAEPVAYELSYRIAEQI